MTTKVKHPRFYLCRAARIGWRKTLTNLYGRAIKYYPRSIRPKLLPNESNVGHRLLENAAFVYQPEKYEGKILLLLARERDPLLDFLSGWKVVVSSHLSVYHLQGRHRDLITPGTVRETANLIQSFRSSVDDTSWRASA